MQQDFLAHELARAVQEKPELADRPEYRALIGHDEKTLAQLGMAKVAEAMLELCAGLTPEQFEHQVHAFMKTANPRVYQPMRELMDALRNRQFDVFVVTGGGTEFVRAISYDLYAVKPDDVVGTLIAYDYQETASGPALLRTAKAYGDLNEGPPKVTHIQTQLGRRPIFAAGNSGGDRQMLEYAASSAPAMALLLSHDDAEREYAYESRSATLGETESIVDVARQRGWTVASMKDDWLTVF